MNPEMFWMEVTKVVATILASGVAAWVAYEIGSSQRDIAAEQRRIAAAKLNLELFEERYELFSKVWDFLSQAALGRNLDRADVDFGNFIPKARFLFGDDVADYMKEANEKHIDFHVIHHATKNGRATQEEIGRSVELGKWFWEEASNCSKRFAPYLDFSNWKAPE